MSPLKEVTEAILALRRNGYSGYLLTHRTGSSSPPTHTRLDSPTHQLYCGQVPHGAGAHSAHSQVVQGKVEQIDFGLHLCALD